MEPVLHLSLPVADLDAARTFYVDVLGCPPGRVRPEFIDVWFYGMQLTLQERPGEVLAEHAQGVRHFGVALSRDDFDAVVGRLRARAVRFVQEAATDTTGALDGKTNVKIADPSGNVIELKTYPGGGDGIGGRTE